MRLYKIPFTLSNSYIDNLLQRTYGNRISKPILKAYYCYLKIPNHLLFYENENRYKEKTQLAIHM